MDTCTVYEPASAYRLLPDTVKTPPLSVMIPALPSPSPHTMFAVKSAELASGLPSVNVATEPLYAAPSAALMDCPAAVNAASVTVAVVVTSAPLPPLSRIETETAYEPAFAYWLLPETL